MELNKAKNHLKTQGWTQEQAAKRFNLTTSYVNRVLNGDLKSRRLISAVLSLGPNPDRKKQPVYTKLRRAA